MTMTRPPALTDEQADLVAVTNSAGAPDQG